MSVNYIKADTKQQQMLSITPSSANWKFLSFSVRNHTDGSSWEDQRPNEETAIVPISGKGTFVIAGEQYELSRVSIFSEMPQVLYVHPGENINLLEGGDLCFAIGSAPAEGVYPTRLFEPQEMHSEIRGGGAAYRQVNHILAAPLPAERLILFEVYVPRGSWSGWAPHCHDGRDGSPYLEESYYFKLQPENGFWMHRNWRDDEQFNDIISGHDGDCAIVPKGYHSSVCCPGSHMYFLNFLAGDLLHEKRSTPPCYHSDYTWIEEDWEQGAWELPIVQKPK
ncbi:MAG: 5-deoxy-glucuronate isomerase [Arenicella sp.]